MRRVLVVTAAAARGDDRVIRSAAAHALLREVLTELTGLPPEAHRFDRRCGACGGAHGKPVLDHPSLHVSLGTTDGLLAVAVTAAGPVGVDGERRDRVDFAGFAGVVAAPGEELSDPARTWTRKEAWLKAAGTGLAVDPRTIDASAPPEGVQLRDVPVPGGYAAAAAVLTAGPVTLEVRHLG